MWLGGHEKCGFCTCLGYTFPSTEVHVSIDTSLQFGTTLVTRPLVLINTQSCVFVICAGCFWIRLGSHFLPLWCDHLTHYSLIVEAETSVETL
jgi:hypothetical protein